MRWQFWRRGRYQYRVIVCNKGSIFDGEKTAWRNRPDHPELVAFVDRHGKEGLVMHDCNFISWEPEFHSRHLELQERIA